MYSKPCQAGFRSNHPEVLFKKDILENLAKFTETLLTLLNSNFIKKETLTQVCSCKFCEIFKSNFLYRTLLVAAPLGSNYASANCIRYITKSYFITEMSSKPDPLFI